MQRICSTLDDFIDLREWLHRQPFVALDSETTGLDIYSPNFRVRTVQLGNRNEAWFIPVEQGWYGPIREMLASYSGNIGIHNSSYDIQALARHDIHIPWHQVTDTMIAMRLAEPHKPAGLKPASIRHVSRSAAGGQDDLKKAMRTHKWDWATIPVDFPAYVFYSCLDVILLARLMESDACRDGLSSPVYEMEMDVRNLCTMMETRGMRIDREFCEMRSKEFDVRMFTLEHRLKGRIGSVNPRSPAELARWCIANGGVIEGKTAHGSPLATKDSLELCASTAPPRVAGVIHDALQLRKLGKIQSSYFDNFLSMSDSDGFLHPSINTIHAKTGRMSISNPALQTLPSDGADPDYGLIRQAVIPWQEDHKLVSCDYEQIELRAIASKSEDPLLVKAFLDSDAGGTDFFTTAMREVYDDPRLPKADRRRHLIKTLFYASAYGAGLTKMAVTAGVPEADMASVRTKVFTKYTGMTKLMRAFEHECKANDGWITTLYGRQIYVDPTYAYKGLNAFVQGSAADILKAHLVELGHAGFDTSMVVPVHDEIVFSLQEDLIDDARPVIQTTMTDRTYAVPLLAAPSHGGDTWAELK